MDVVGIIGAIAGLIGAVIVALAKWREMSIAREKAEVENDALRKEKQALQDDARRKITEADIQFQSDGWRQYVKDMRDNYTNLTERVQALQDEHIRVVNQIEENRKADIVAAELRERACKEELVKVSARLRDLEAKV